MKTALLSVWDKTGLVAFARRLAAADWRLIASGGTARALESAGLEVTPVEQITGEPELLGGRVKTLHPAIHAGLLARATDEDRAALRARGWLPIDLAVVNLYPFEQVIANPQATLAEAIENIDIGGVALLRAAAKNYARVAVLCEPADYPADLAVLDDPAYRLRLAYKAFALSARYDAAIGDYLAAVAGEVAPLRLTLYPVLPLRYGENPHQRAAFYSPRPDGAPLNGRLLQGKALSYNNLLDLDSAWGAVLRFAEPAAVVVKHASPCGIAIAERLEDAIGPAIASDPVSAFGGVIAANREVSAGFVERLGDLFLECIVAPSFSAEARALLAARKNLRVLEMPLAAPRAGYELRSVEGGYLWQERDLGDPADAPAWRVVTRRAPTEAEMAALRFAWQAVQPLKSNAVLLARVEGSCACTVGIGSGQPNRVDCVQIAGQRAGSRAVGSVLASDAFFPFPDGVQAAARLGVTAIIQPAGSLRDEQIIAAADELGLALVFTGVRHFRH
ncbi:MAG: bifunctional phosphoribosylaminoimidazolecarboxamide formyltransferase/IMP cyclohydrolase [Anaerolineae bacterium]